MSEDWLYNCTMKQVVVDASVILCILLREDDWKMTATALEGYALIGASSLPFEIGNSLSALVRRGVLNPDIALSVWEAFLEIPIRTMEVPMKTALAMAFSRMIYAYDAYVLALGQSENAGIATLDKTMIRHAVEIGLVVVEA